MEIASRMAFRAKGTTAPNPNVGAIIVKDGKIISRGWTGKNGRPHAEFNAIKRIKNKKKLNGATLYCTLEPCSHKGKTGPCADLILKHGFKNIFISSIDKNKVVDGKGIQKLKQNNVNVKFIRNKKINLFNNIFFNSINKKKPFLTLKIASTIDSKIATSNFESKWITSKASRLIGHSLRFRNDCLLTTSQTVLKDNPLLDCRLDGLESYSPDIFILDRELKIDLTKKVFRKKNRKIFILHNIIPTKIKSLRYKKKKIELISISQNNGSLNIKEVLEKITDYGYQSILVEGGGKISASLLSNNLVDKIYWFKASKFIGQEGISAIENLGIHDMKSIKKFNLSKVIKLEDDTLNIFIKK
jgi:diaminohydroxyphosphoribosylaminopyrimidine deaminase/5-amino-6-(5-phosphoribosylamino)uracil reductase